MKRFDIIAWYIGTKGVFGNYFVTHKLKVQENRQQVQKQWSHFCCLDMRKGKVFQKQNLLQVFGICILKMFALLLLDHFS